MWNQWRFQFGTDPECVSELGTSLEHTWWKLCTSDCDWIDFLSHLFVLFRALILKMNLKTPGREADDEESKLYTKKEYKAKKENSSDNKYQIAAEVYMEGLGGKENIIDVTNCATPSSCIGEGC